MKNIYKRRLLFSMIACALLPMLLITLTLNRAYCSKIRENTINNNLAAVKQVAQEFDRITSRLNYQAYVSNYNEIRYYATRAFETDVIRFNRLSDRMNESLYDLNSVQIYFAFFSRFSYLLGTQYPNFSVDFRRIPESYAAYWTEKYRNGDFGLHSNADFLYVLCPIVNVYGENCGTVCAGYDMSHIDEFLKPYQKSTLGDVYIFDSDKKLVYTSGESNALNAVTGWISAYSIETGETSGTLKGEDNLLLTACASDSFGYTVASVIPSDVLFVELGYLLSRVLIIVCIIALLVGILTLLNSNYLYHPIKNIMGMLEKGENARERIDEMEYIRAYVQSSRNDHLDYQGMMEENKSQLCNITLQNLLFGIDVDPDLLYDLMKINQAPDNLEYSIIAMRSDSMTADRYSVFKLVNARNLLHKELESLGYRHYASYHVPDMVYALIIFEKGSADAVFEENIRTSCDNVRGTIREEHGNTVSAAVINHIPRLQDLVAARKKGHEMLRRTLMLGGDTTLSSGDMQDDETANYCTMFNSRVVYDCLVRKDRNLLKTAIEDALKLLTRISGNNVHMFINLATSLLHGTLETLSQANCDAYKQIMGRYAYEGIYIAKTNEEICAYVTAFILQLSDSIEPADYPHNTDKIRKAIRYIELHYREELSLPLVAGQVDMSVSYCSRMFKQKTGYSFTEYTNNVRLEKSLELLTQTRYTIKEIAADVGYLSEHNYIRMFKQRYKCTPGQYRARSMENK